ncbi:sodium:proton antiporter [Clostridium sp. A1-XYC3]|uniref:Sodium:proton antiporter n=1 Tax=Clostridium tanneri TaxID=3037988 RepID=A0ABU4JN52_9CLOT|nr:sodium:proton antiporter [Clostridium sp. A1-XYC3]MDW8799545.1 sodium:proton antiporter [Clostridium sp. A1-XYC3]
MEGNTVLLAENLMKLLFIIIISGVVFAKIGKKIKMPDVVLFIIAGIIVGPSVLNLVDFSSYPIENQLILTFGAAYILYDGGREIQLKVLNEVKGSVAVLATAGVIISAFITGFFAYKVLHIDFIYALLLGSVIASTDPSVLVPLFKNMNISPKLKQTIISESAFNDAVGAIMTFAIIGIISGGSFSLGHSIIELLKEAGGGTVVGAIFGFLGTALVSEAKVGVLRGYAGEVAVALVLASYVTAVHFGFSGFMAVFIVGMVCGNKKMFGLASVDEESYELHSKFKEVTISMLRIMIFVLLGVQMNFAILSKYWGKALIIVLGFVFIARPVSVLFSVIFDRKAKWNIREIAYLMWTRETGVIPAALAGMLISMKIQNADIISAVTSMAIIITLTFQASTAKYFAKILKLDIDSGENKEQSDKVAA